MNKIETYSDYIDRLVRLQVPFAFFRRSGEEIGLVVQTEGDVCSIDDICRLDGMSGYVMAPFQVRKECPVVVIRPDCTDVCALERFLNRQEADGSTRSSEMQPADRNEADCCESEEEYAWRIRPFVEALQDGEFDKLVFSRKRQVDCRGAVSVGEAFKEACSSYPQSYVYVCYTPQTGLWMGSTPEIILAGEDEQWHTVALAGTQSMQGDELPSQWSPKNRREQAYVTEYIRSILQNQAQEVRENGPFTVQAGALAHLKTEFLFRLAPTCTPAQLLEQLHPTPAVCGLPKAESFGYIVRREGYDRSYYSGFTGCWNYHGRTDLYVNLRCMRREGDRAVLYAGGGILKSSDVHEEWLETEKKMQTMCRLISERCLR